MFLIFYVVLTHSELFWLEFVFPDPSQKSNGILIKNLVIKLMEKKLFNHCLAKSIGLCKLFAIMIQS